MARFPPLAVTEDQVLDALINAYGNQRVAAQALGVTQSWVAKFLKKHGYVQRVTWIKPQEDSSIA